MKRIFSLAVCIFVVVASLSCSLSSKTATPNTDLVGTTQALTMQATIQSGIISTDTVMAQGPGTLPASTATPPPLATDTATAAPASDAPALQASGSGTSEYTIKNFLPIYNLHVIAANAPWPTLGSLPMRSVAVKDWATGNVVLGERWFAIRTALGVGKYSVKAHGGAQWEIWSVGSPPLSFSVHSIGTTMQAGVSDYFFKIDRKGIYQIAMDVTSGSYVLYIGCGYASATQSPRDLVTFTQTVMQTGSYETNLNPGICFVEVATLPNSIDPQWKISLEDTGK